MSTNFDARSALSMLADACADDWHRWVLPRLNAVEAALDERDALMAELARLREQNYLLACTVEDLSRNIESARKQEPVHWRAIISDKDAIHEIDTAKHIFGFTKLSAAESWIASARDFQGLDYRLQPLYASPVPAQQAEALAVLSSAIDTLKTVADNCEWSHSDFPVIARAEKLLQETPCTE